MHKTVDFCVKTRANAGAAVLRARKPTISKTEISLLLGVRPFPFLPLSQDKPHADPDVFAQLLEVDHRKRFTYREIRRHPWFSGDSPNEFLNIEARTRNLRRLSSPDSPQYREHRDTSGLEKLDLLRTTTREQEISEGFVGREAVWRDFAWVNPMGLWKEWKPVLRRQKRAFGLS